MIIAQSAAVSIGFVLDAIFGDPDFKLHPIRLIGYLISFLEKVMRRIFTKNERLGGAVMAICVLIICGGLPFAILFFAYRLNYFFGIAIESVICYFMLAAKSLKQAGMSVYKPLKNGDVDGARKSVSMIVGRDTESLDDIGMRKIRLTELLHRSYIWQSAAVCWVVFTRRLTRWIQWSVTRTTGT